MWWKLVCVLAFIYEVRGQLNLLGISLPLDLNLGGNKGGNKVTGNKPQPTTIPTTTTTTTTTTPTPSTTKKPPCQPSITLYPNGEAVRCRDRLIFEDYFEDNSINRNKWVIEQYTPIVTGPEFEFVSYQNSDQTLFIRDGKLFIKPVALMNDEEVKGILDLREGCTKYSDLQCYYEQQAGFILPPVKSAKVASKFSFTYGKIEVRAKLPSGDWIFPQLQLVPRTPSKEGLKIWIGFARGNDFLLSNTGDVGSRLLFGGPVLGVKEPDRSLKVSNRSAAFAYGNDMHVYTVIWEPSKITVAVDGEIYGTALIDPGNRFLYSFFNEMYVSFGVGVGGIIDFPDDFLSSRPKPWKNTEAQQLKQFFNARETWLRTWNGDNAALQIDYVKIWSL